MPIHPTAIVSPKAEIDPTAEIGPYAIVEEGAVIGPDTRLWPHAFVGRDTRLGRENEIHMGAVIGHLPQDRSFTGARTHLEIGDRNIFREGFQVHRGASEGSVTRIGSGGFFMATSHVGHDCEVGDEVTMCNCALLAGHVTVGDRVFLSGCAVVHQFVRVGRLVMAAGAARVAMDVPPFMLVQGESKVHQLNIVGLSRDPSISRDARRTLKEAFRVLYRSGRPLKEAVARLEADFETPEVAELVAFLKAESKRGISRPARSRRGA